MIGLKNGREEEQTVSEKQSQRGIHIVNLCAYYSPEIAAGTHLSDDIEEACVRAGCTLDIHTPSPCRGLDKETIRQYKHNRYEERRNGRVHIHRFRMMTERRNPLLRAFRYFLSNEGLYYSARNTKDADIVVASSTPPIKGLVAARLARHLNVPFLFDLQDIFPESLVTTGLTHEGSLLYRTGDRVSDRIYRRADRILVISQNMRDTLIAKGVPADKITVIYTWVDEQAVTPVAREDNRLFDELDLPRDRFYVTYAGNLGYCQGVDVLLDAATRLKEREDIRFVVFGGGALYEPYQKRIADEGLTNVALFPMQDLSRVAEVYSLGDASLVTCKKGVSKGGLPSKTWNVMATTTPVLLSFDADTEWQQIVEQHRAGLFSEAEDAAALADNIVYLHDHPDEAAVMGQNGRKLVGERFSKTVCTRQYVKLVADMVGGKSQKQEERAYESIG